MEQDGAASGQGKALERQVKAGDGDGSRRKSQARQKKEFRYLICQTV